MWVFSFLPRFFPNLVMVIFAMELYLSSFIGTNHIENSSNVAKILAEMKKPTLETYVGHWKTYLGIPMSNIGFQCMYFKSNIGFPRLGYYT